MSNQQDQLHRFLFADSDVRGELVTASETFQQFLENHNYPKPVQILLGELLVATSLLTATLKFDGNITVQIQGDGPVTLAVINGNDKQQMRGIARFNGDVAPNATLHEMVGKAIMVITITPTNGERYQGIVALEHDTIEACIDNYFRQSEQLPTHLFIRVGEANGKVAAAGMLLQVLPAAREDREEAFNHLVQLTATIKGEELFALDTTEILHRLYHEEDVTLYSPESVSFHCGCSRQRCADTLISLPVEEVEQILQEDNVIDIECEYCGVHQIFSADDIEQLHIERKSQLH